MTVFSSLPTETLSFDRAENIALRRRRRRGSPPLAIDGRDCRYREARTSACLGSKRIDASYRSSLNHTWGTDADDRQPITSSGATSRSTTDSGPDRRARKTATDGTVENTSENDCRAVSGNSYGHLQRQ